MHIPFSKDKTLYTEMVTHYFCGAPLTDEVVKKFATHNYLTLDGYIFLAKYLALVGYRGPMCKYLVRERLFRKEKAIEWLFQQPELIEYYGAILSFRIALGEYNEKSNKKNPL